MIAAKVYLFVMLLAILGLYIHAFLFFPVNTDAGFYLSITERWLDGAELYQDFWMQYTPMGIYLLGQVSIWTSEPVYTDYLVIIYLFNFANAGLVYIISKKLGLNQLIALGAAIFSLGLFYKYETTFIVLEPFAVFFLLAATYLALFTTQSDRFWIPVGFFLGMAFLCKQYALGIVPGLLFWMYKMGGWRYMGRLMGMGLIGFVIPIMFLLFNYWWSNGLQPLEILQAWFSGGGYGEYNLGEAFWSLCLFFILSVPIILSFPLTISEPQPTFGFKLGGEKYFLLSLMGGMILPLFIQQYGHYFLFIIPFAVLLGAYLLKSQGKYTDWVYILLAINMAFFSVRIIRATHQAVNFPQYARIQQFEHAHQISEVVPENTKVLLLSYFHQRLNYVCKFLPTQPEKFGYTFPENLTPEQLSECLRDAEVVITEAYDLEKYPHYRSQLNLHQFAYEQKIGELQIWRKK